MKAEPVGNCQILRNHMWFRKSLCTTNCCRLVYTETISKSFLCSFIFRSTHFWPSSAVGGQLSLVWPVLAFCGILLKEEALLPSVCSTALIQLHFFWSPPESGWEAAQNLSARLPICVCRIKPLTPTCLCSPATYVCHVPDTHIYCRHAEVCW